MYKQRIIVTAVFFNDMEANNNYVAFFSRVFSQNVEILDIWDVFKNHGNVTSSELICVKLWPRNIISSDGIVESWFETMEETATSDEKPSTPDPFAKLQNEEIRI